MTDTLFDLNPEKTLTYFDRIDAHIQAHPYRLNTDTNRLTLQRCQQCHAYIFTGFISHTTQHITPLNLTPPARQAAALLHIPTYQLTPGPVKGWKATSTYQTKPNLTDPIYTDPNIIVCQQHSHNQKQLPFIPTPIDLINDIKLPYDPNGPPPF